MTITVGGTSGISFTNGTQATSNMAAFAAQALGAVGTYAMLRPNNTVGYGSYGNAYGAPMGTNVAGSGLYYSNAYGPTGGAPTTSPAGTWKLLGTGKSGDTGGYGVHFFVRIS